MYTTEKTYSILLLTPPVLVSNFAFLKLHYSSWPLITHYFKKRCVTCSGFLLNSLFFHNKVSTNENVTFLTSKVTLKQEKNGYESLSLLFPNNYIIKGQETDLVFAFFSFFT